ncbi:cobalamin biosynthesis protein CobW [Synechococcus sp. Nb3U1]|uniref:cobalamin biosynthesis protein CobW n=1 Tax=Synechococcus sp. Nb3U1 TaxID=1914529 RepID=UPI001F42D035|nr:cobalamin biosynthesis protein CobW [Synechococcus sp. Nb3U1]MCF2971122.1 cobalamin biosynthesis protein CobW [Synechococcus sp. Nb3U1]
MHKIPVTVITGFLGSGKTTLIRHLLRNPEGRRIAVIVNEFGEMGIDGELLQDCQICEEGGSPTAPAPILELANGCLCCTVQEEFLPTMEELLQRREDLDCIVIETSGLALPKPLVQAFRWPTLRTGATVDGVITVVDCQALARGEYVSNLAALEAQRQVDTSLDHETPIEELFEDQLSCADLVLLTKVDQVSPTERFQVENWLRQELPTGIQVIPCQQGQIAAAVLLGFSAAVEDQLDQRPSHHDHEGDHDHEAFDSLHLTLPPISDPGSLIAQLRQLVEKECLYRVKGFVAVTDKSMRMVLQGVGSRFETYYDRPWRTDELRQTRLVLIGQHLDRKWIQAQLQPMPTG